MRVRESEHLCHAADGCLMVPPWDLIEVTVFGIRCLVDPQDNMSSQTCVLFFIVGSNNWSMFETRILTPTCVFLALIPRDTYSI